MINAQVETADDVRMAVRNAINTATTHSELLRLLMTVAYPTVR
jgi:hypothetical protein